jgi:putative transcriptional regulator
MCAVGIAATIRCGLLVLICGAGVAGASIPAPVAPAAPAQAMPRPAPGMFLVARRGFADPFFRHSVIWLLQHDKHGTFGLIINGPQKRVLSDVAATVRGSWLQALPVFHGGPVDADTLVILVRGAAPPELSRYVTGDVYASIHGQLLNQLLAKPRPADSVRFFLGHAGWVPDQLEAEIRRGNWLLLEGDIAVVFGPGSTGIWETLIERADPAGVNDSP